MECGGDIAGQRQQTSARYNVMQFINEKSFSTCVLKNVSPTGQRDVHERGLDKFDISSGQFDHITLATTVVSQ